MERTPGGSSSPEPGNSPQQEYQGYGEVSPVSGLARFYDFSAEESQAVTWFDILEEWELIEADMHEHYHIDLAEPGLLTARSGRWFRTRVRGLFGIQSRLRFKFYPPKEGD